MGENYYDVAVRHWIDGKILEENEEYDNAVCMQGFSAECALKKILLENAHCNIKCILRHSTSYKFYKKLLDEGLIEAGDKVAVKNEQRTEVILSSFSTTVQEIVMPFIENIRMINTIRNGCIEIIFDGESLYYRRKSA